MSCGVGCRRGWDLALLWLRRRLAVVALMRPLVWAPPYAAGVALKKKTSKNTNLKLLPLSIYGARQVYWQRLQPRHQPQHPYHTHTWALTASVPHPHTPCPAAPPPPPNTNRHGPMPTVHVPRKSACCTWQSCSSGNLGHRPEAVGTVGYV